MIRAWLAIAVWGVMLIVLGVPVLIAGLVHPSRHLIAWMGTLWARLMLGICGIRLTIEGLEHARDGRAKFFMGNHQSALDIPIIVLALDGDVRFIAKSTLFRAPIFGWIIGRYGNVPVDRTRPRMALKNLNRMLERVKDRPISLAVFPEGTRSADGRLLRFRKGTMKIGQRAGLPIVPFSIDGSFAVNPRDRLRVYPGPVRLTFASPIPADEVAAMSPAELHDRVRGTIARQLGKPWAPGSEEDPFSSPGEVDSEQQRNYSAAAHS